MNPPPYDEKEIKPPEDEKDEPPPPPYYPLPVPEYHIDLDIWNVTQHWPESQKLVTFIIGRRKTGRTTLVKYLLPLTSGGRVLITSTIKNEYSGIQMVTNDLKQFLQNHRRKKKLCIIIDTIDTFSFKDTSLLLNEIVDSQNCFWFVVSNVYKSIFDYIADQVFITKGLNLEDCRKLGEHTFGKEYLQNVLKHTKDPILINVNEQRPLVIVPRGICY